MRILCKWSCGTTGLTKKFPNQQTVLQGIHIMQGCDLCLSFKFPKFISYRKKKVPFIVVWFCEPERAAVEKLCLTGFLANSKNQNWSKALK